jgi:hypothetical protein
VAVELYFTYLHAVRVCANFSYLCNVLVSNWRGSWARELGEGGGGGGAAVERGVGVRRGGGGGDRGVGITIDKYSLKGKNP